MEEGKKIETQEDLVDTILYGSLDELNQLKAFLFKESIRLDMERKDIEELRDKTLKEREQLRIESDEVNQRIVIERKRLKDEQKFFDKKMNILKNGFEALEADRKAVKRAREQLEQDRAGFYEGRSHLQNEEAAALLFTGVNSYMGLKKRYKDLLKIFHPDNINGDSQMVLVINKLYEDLKKSYESSKIV